MSYDFAKIMRAQGEQLTLHSFIMMPKVDLKERAKQMEVETADAEIKQEQAADDSSKPVIMAKSYAIYALLSIVNPIAGIVSVTSGILLGKKVSFLDQSRTPSTEKIGDWLGYEFSEDNPGITAWIGKIGAKAQNEWGYAGVNAYLGKAEAEAKLDFSFMKKENKREYKNNEWENKPTTTYLVTEAKAGASISAISVDASGGIGSDMLGVEGKAEGTAGNANAEVKARFSVGEDGVSAYAKGEAIVSAVEGEASGTINILGFEITGKVGGYAGAVGVEGKFGVENNKLVTRIGAAALLGVSGGVEIGFNDEGWDNFVDFIIFWD